MRRTLALATALATALVALAGAEARADVAGTWNLVGPDGQTRGSLELAVSTAGEFSVTRTLDGKTDRGSARRAANVLHVQLERQSGFVDELDFERLHAPRTPVRFDLAIAKGPRWGDELLSDPSSDLRYVPVWKEQPLAALSPDLEAYAASRQGDVAVCVRDYHRRIVFTRNASTQIRTASIVKMIILAGVFDRANAQGRGLTGFESANAPPMIEQSDNDAATNLFNDIGAAAGLQAIANKAGMRSTAANDAWGYTETTAPDMALLAAEIYDESLLGPAASEQALSYLTRISPAQSFGVGATPAGYKAFKNGWYPETESGVWRVNTVGVVRDGGADVGYSVCVLSRYPIGNGQGYGNAACSTLCQQIFAAAAKNHEVVPPVDPPPPPPPAVAPVPAPEKAPPPPASKPRPEPHWWERAARKLHELVSALGRG